MGVSPPLLLSSVLQGSNSAQVQWTNSSTVESLKKPTKKLQRFKPLEDDLLGPKHFYSENQRPLQLCSSPT